MCGRWLEQAGFAIGAVVHVTVKHGRVIVTTSEAALEAAIADADAGR
jgi:hypothetical protein